MRLAELRKQAGISQRALATALNCSQNMVSQWENGTRDPSTETIKAIADYFKVSTDYLLEREATAINLEEQSISFSPDFIDLYGIYEKLPRQKRALVFEMARAMSGEEI